MFKNSLFSKLLQPRPKRPKAEEIKFPAERWYWCNLPLLSSRYSLGVKNFPDGPLSLILFDNLYGLEREFTVNDRKPVLTNSTRLVPINCEYLLLITSTDLNGKNASSVQLLHLNIGRTECTVVDETFINGWHIRTKVDEVDPSKFVIIVIYEGVYYLYKVILVGEGQFLLHTDKTMLKFDYNFDPRPVVYRLLGNKMYFLKIEVDADKELFSIDELTIDADQVKCANLCTFEMDRIIRIYENTWFGYDWSGETCYLSECDADCTRIIKIDLEARQIEEIEFDGTGYICDLKVDSGELAISTINNLTVKRFVHRLPLEKPAKLFNLALNAVRRQIPTLSEEDLHALIQKMPSNLRPFNG